MKVSIYASNPLHRWPSAFLSCWSIGSDIILTEVVVWLSDLYICFLKSYDAIWKLVSDAFWKLAIFVAETIMQIYSYTALKAYHWTTLQWGPEAQKEKESRFPGVVKSSLKRIGFQFELVGLCFLEEKISQWGKWPTQFKTFFL